MKFPSLLSILFVVGMNTLVGCETAKAPVITTDTEPEPTAVAEPTPDIAPNISPEDTEDPDTTVITDGEVDDTNPTDTEGEDTPSSPVDLSIYEDWMLNEDVIAMNGLNFQEDVRMDKVDCVDLENGDRGYQEAGDLLSTLIADSTARGMMNLDRYTPEYIQRLEKEVVDAVQENFYASIVCHVDGVDLVGGGTSDVESYEDNILVLVNGEKAHVYRDIQLYDQTATGGEFYSCDVEGTDDTILWTCFTGFQFAENDDLEYEMYKTWIIPIDGGSVETTEDIVPL